MNSTPKAKRDIEDSIILMIQDFEDSRIPQNPDSLQPSTKQAVVSGEIPDEYLSVSMSRLVCQACREELSTKTTALKFHNQYTFNIMLNTAKVIVRIMGKIRGIMGVIFGKL